MSDSEFPPNSDKSKLGETENKKVKQVTSSPAIRRKKGLGKQFKKTFFGGDARGAFSYMIFNVFIPSTKEAFVDAVQQGIRQLVLGESSRQRNAPSSGPGGYVSYNRYAMGQQQRPRTISQRGRARHDFDEIILETRQEAEDAIDRLYDLVGKFGAATVSDLYELVGIQSTHADQKWGWEELRGAGVSRVRGGYLLDLPEPEPIQS
jgi:hypothetical protein